MAKSIELGDDVMSLVHREAELRGRSVTEQIIHWLRIGVAIEKSGTFDDANIAAVLAGEHETTSLTALEKAVWSERFLEKISEPGPGEEAFFAELRKSGNTFDLDVLGEIVCMDAQPHR